MIRIPCHQKNTVSKQAGFTLIELMVAMTIMVLLSSVGISSFVTYSRSQSLQNATQDIVTMLQLAKASSNSQVKPTTCTDASETLDGYEIIITSSNTYTMGPVCNEELKQVERKDITLPKNIEFISPSQLNIIFHTVSGVVTFDSADPNYADIEIQEVQSGSIKTIRVFSDGRINVLQSEE